MPAVATDPPVSEKQRRAMFAAAAGHSNLGISERVGREFSDADRGGKLPAKARDMTRAGWGKIMGGLSELAKFFAEEEREPEHEEAEDGWVAADEWSDEARRAAAAARGSKSHLHMTATPSTGSKASHRTQASSHGEVEKHLSALHEHVKKNNLGEHRVSIENKDTGEVHHASVSPHGIHGRSYSDKAFDSDTVKLDKAEVKYGPGREDERCDECAHYRSTGACVLVDGEIDPNAWCELFHPASDPDTAPRVGSEDDRSEPKGRAASVAFVTPDARVLMLRRARDEENFPGYWSLPGGKCDEGEEAEEAAKREAYEEIGDCGFDGIRSVHDGRTEHGWQHTTFAVPVRDSFVPRLNGEHDDWCWAHPDECPRPVHPGVAALFERAMGGQDEGTETREEHEGKLSEHTREHIGTVGSKQREGLPDSDFLEPASKKYPVRKDGKYDRSLLLAAAREARAHGHEDLAGRADAIRAREFGSDAGDEIIHDPDTGQFTSSQRTAHKHLTAAGHEFHGTTQRKTSSGLSPVNTYRHPKSEITTRVHSGGGGIHQDPEGRSQLFNRIHPQDHYVKGGVFPRRNGNMGEAGDRLPADTSGERVRRTSPGQTEGARRFREGPEGSNINARPGAGFSMSRGVLRDVRRVDSGRPGQWNTGSGAGAADEGRYLALDRSSARSYDSNGNLLVDRSHISKATVNDYYGHEINAAMKGRPGWRALDEDKKYQLYRHPEELEKAASSFNKLPVLRKHSPISARKFRPEEVIGTTGDHATFDGEYLDNSLAFWTDKAIDDIEDEARKQLSAAYSYDADMTPGEHNGTKYDGVMRNIRGNHVALVRDGRAGPEVAVGDADPDSEENDNMPTTRISARSRLVSRVIGRYAADASPEELAELVGATRGEKEDGEDAFPEGGMETSEGDKRARMVMDALRKGGADDETCNTVMDALRTMAGDRRARDEGEEESDEEREARAEEEEKEEAEDRRVRADDARRKLGRDETPDERDMRERADDARRRLGRDEEPDEREEREESEAEDRARRAEDARKRLGKDEVPHDVLEGELEKGRAQDRRRHADDRRRADDMRKADDRRRADDARRKADDRRMRAGDKRAKDEPPAFPGRPEPGGKMTAMDEKGVARLIARTQQTERENAVAVRKAVRDVSAWTGNLAFDEATTADDVYREALEHVGVDTKGIHPSAFRVLLDAQPRPGQERPAARRERTPAMDAAASGFADMFPETSGIRSI